MGSSLARTVSAVQHVEADEYRPPQRLAGEEKDTDARCTPLPKLDEYR